MSEYDDDDLKNCCAHENRDCVHEELLFYLTQIAAVSLTSVDYVLKKMNIFLINKRKNSRKPSKTARKLLFSSENFSLKNVILRQIVMESETKKNRKKILVDVALVLV